MPIYEYQCQKCHSHFEKRQGVTEDPLTTCEKCGGPLEKQWSLSGFQFKGAGWYVTDYAAKKDSPAGKSGGAEKSEKSSAGESTAKVDTASNSKSETPVAPAKDSAAKKE
jgi:putative FmdB family regulatory protein